MQVLEYMAREGHEQIMMCVEPSVGLKAFIAVHDTTLGPACGGCRIWPHANEAAALEDVLRLSKAMTYKSAAAELPLGGGKGLIIADPRKDKTEGLMRAFGRFVDSLGGRYITTEDVGCSLRDMEYVSLETKHVVGLPRSMGGSGETSIMTGLGVYMGMKAAAKAKWGSDSLSGRTVAIQGFGNVAANLAPHLV
jgi:leucine dehydrogenase